MAGSADGRRGRVALLALGCRVNRADVDGLAAELAGSFEIARRGERADFVVVNTCSVTADAAAAARQAIRRAAHDHPGAAIVAAGCHAEVAPADLGALPGVAAVVGARAQARVVEVLRALGRGEAPAAAAAPLHGAGAGWGIVAEAPVRHTRPFLKVQDGCDRRCSYCVVPLARGASRSLPFDEALRRMDRLGGRHREVVLTGVHLGAYGRDLETPRSLAELVGEAARRGAVRRLRLSSVEPEELARELLEHAAPGGALCPHFHLPLQSGSPRLLAAMGRAGGPEAFREAAAAALRAAPGAAIGTDVIAGFPGERAADHEATVALLDASPLAYVHVFPFSPRPGTPAAELPERIPAQRVRERAAELRALSDRKWRAFVAARLGRVLEVVVERIDRGFARGTAREWVTVRWPASGEARGGLVRVRVLGHDGTECVGVREG